MEGLYKSRPLLPVAVTVNHDQSLYEDLLESWQTQTP
nr:hypothetical protein [Mucilaginibacter sp. SP1R1]